MRPPFSVTPSVLTLVSEISLFLGRLEGLRAPTPQPQLRRQNRIKTIQGSLAIEGNTLGLDQVTAILDKKRIAGPRKDITEVENALRLYEATATFKAHSLKDFLKAHGILMKNLAADAGKFRAGAVGVLKGSKVAHVAPSAKRVPALMEDLFRFLKNDDEIPALIKACVVHYEIEFIHPFSDGNGRMGRFWQSVALARYHPLFEYIPVESLIKERQPHYYRVLGECDKKGDCTAFLEFMLEALRDALGAYIDELKPEPETSASRLRVAREHFEGREFTRKDYLAFFKTISTATASRDLVGGVADGALRKSGARALTRYRFHE